MLLQSLLPFKSLDTRGDYKKRKIKSYPEVRFLELFDTVHSFPYAVTWAWKDNYIANNVKNSSHAISLDENRSFFRNSNLQSPTNGNHYVKYFPGVHSDIGGTMSSVIGNYTLRWMIDKAIEAGVKMDTSNLKTLDWFEKQRIRQPMMFQPFLNSGLSNIFQD